MVISENLFLYSNFQNKGSGLLWRTIPFIQTSLREWKQVILTVDHEANLEHEQCDQTMNLEQLEASLK